MALQSSSPADNGFEWNPDGKGEAAIGGEL